MKTFETQQFRVNKIQKFKNKKVLEKYIKTLGKML
jgi:hypothetical protein